MIASIVLLITLSSVSQGFHADTIGLTGGVCERPCFLSQYAGAAYW
jgi:hypothetical protein